MRLGNVTAAAGVALLSSLLCSAFAPSQANDLDPANWPGVLEEARGQTVYWHAWGCEQRINDYIRWAGEQVERRYGVDVEHVKLSDTAEAVTRVVAEKSAGRHSGGSVDLIWINGESERPAVWPLGRDRSQFC
jgi:putative thiamine transport system substrate-binding protein